MRTAALMSWRITRRFRRSGTGSRRMLRRSSSNGPDGSRLRTEISSVPLRDKSGLMTGAVSVIVDVHEREQAREQQEILVGELAHRMKNTMAMVQAIVHQSLRSAATLEDARESVTERFEALARAQDLLTASNWQASDLDRVVKNCSRVSERR